QCAAILEALVGDVPRDVARQLPQQADARGALVLRAVLRPALREQVVVDRPEVDRRAAAGGPRGLLLRQREALRRLVADVAVVLLVRERQAQRRGLAERQVERAAPAHAAVVGEAELEVAELLP